MYRILIQVHLGIHFAGFVPSEAKLKAWAKAALRHKVRSGELTIRLVEKPEIQTLNKTYRHKNKPTNVLSFPSGLPKAVQSKPPFLGDLVICLPVVNEEAKKQKKTPEAHWAHMVIHGTLHLLGYDHAKPSEAKAMEGKEIRLMKNLGYPDPYNV